MNPGQYDRLVVIAQKTSVNEDGATIESYTTLFNWPCQVKTAEADESMEADKIEYQQRLSFQGDYLGPDHGVDGNCKITYAGNDYNVISVEEVGRMQGHKIVGVLHE